MALLRKTGKRRQRVRFSLSCCSFVRSCCLASWLPFLPCFPSSRVVFVWTLPLVLLFLCFTFTIFSCSLFSSFPAASPHSPSASSPHLLYFLLAFSPYLSPSSHYNFVLEVPLVARKSFGDKTITLAGLSTFLFLPFFLLLPFHQSPSSPFLSSSSFLLHRLLLLLLLSLKIMLLLLLVMKLLMLMMFMLMKLVLVLMLLVLLLLLLISNRFSCTYIK